jgi:hypothetical protein
VANNVMAILHGRLSLSRITYFCDLQKATSPIIPLGVIAEIQMGHFRALGLIARDELYKAEIEMVGQLIRTKLSTPFTFLKDEFDWSFEKMKEGFDPIAGLAQRYSDALFVAPPRIESVRKELPDGAAGADLVRGELRRRRDKEFNRMLVDIWGPRGVTPTREDLGMQWAA